MSHGPLRLQSAVERTAPFVGYLSTMLVLWFCSNRTSDSNLATPPLRPWYRHKQGYCFADILRTAQRVMSEVDVLDLARDLKDLPRTRSGPPAGVATQRSHAA